MSHIASHIYSSCHPSTLVIHPVIALQGNVATRLGQRSRPSKRTPLASHDATLRWTIGFAVLVRLVCQAGKERLLAEERASGMNVLIRFACPRWRGSGSEWTCAKALAWPDQRITPRLMCQSERLIASTAAQPYIIPGDSRHQECGGLIQVPTSHATTLGQYLPPKVLSRVQGRG